MADHPTWRVVPPPRCSYPEGNPAAGVCGSPAYYVADSPLGGDPRYFCGDHAPTSAEPIAEPRLLRRISITAEILLAGAAGTPGAAHAEAVALLERLITAAGGVVNLVTVTSALGRPASQAAARTGAGVGEGV